MKRDISSLSEDYKYQKAGWPVRTVFWILAALILCFALLGALGDSSPALNRRTEIMPGAFIEYDRFLRLEKQSQIRILLDDTVRDFSLALNKDYVNKILIMTILPQPASVEISERKIVYHFKSFSAGTIQLSCDPVRFGNHALEVGINGHTKRLPQYIYF